MTPEKAKALKSLLSDPIYLPLVEWLTLQARAMGDIEEVPNIAGDKAQAIEFKAQLKAKRRVEAMLAEIVGVKELPDEPQNEGNDYGVDEPETKTE